MELLAALAIIKIVVVIWTMILVFAIYRYLKSIPNRIPKMIFKGKRSFEIGTAKRKIKVSIK